MSDGFYLMHVNPCFLAPKRGDLLYTATGTKRERTWFIWFVRKASKGRYSVLRVRWWQIDPETRQRLFRSAERHGGQDIWTQDKPWIR